MINSELKKTLVSEDEIQVILTRISNEINEDYRDKKLLICGILKGAFIFTSDLIRRINTPSSVELTFIKTASYGKNATSSGVITVDEFWNLSDYENQGYSVLVIDDIIDAGFTLDFLEDYFKKKGFLDINFCVLLDKPERRQKPIYVKYIGKQIENEFVVGYGLDYNEKYRELPYIAAICTT
jgi:hypoxanthine phosphoribosyltransferase